MKKSIELIVLITLFTACSSRTTLTNEEVIQKISMVELQKHVTELADDKYQGRGAGYKGEHEAALYIARQYQNIGLEPFYEDSKNPVSYFQEFDFEVLDSTKPWEILSTQNVVGFLKGTEKPNEYIVIGGHHDGQGMSSQADYGRSIPEDLEVDSIRASNDKIWNSAVDNAVSISAIIEMARVLKKYNIRTKRSIIFTTFSAEENGLNGSAFFANDPPVPIKNIKAMVNLEKIIGDPDAEFLYVSYGTNPVFEEIRIETDSLRGLKMTPFYPGMIANTDHYAFGQRRIPTITMGTGSIKYVHTSLDHADRLNYELLNKRTQYILSYLIRLVNADSDFKFSGSLDGLLGVTGGQASEEEKKIKNFNGDVAFKISTVVNDSHGYNADLKSGDLIIAIDNMPLKRKSFYNGLEDLIGDITEETIGEVEKSKVTLQLIRGDSIIVRTITLK
ncbi:M28 family peptidase [Robiginitalea aurantiaca]|uniref:M28 family peptidase n=1 Tax=Robiginitalea aurantiaca TaxID=3056915 RepID=A0ABT7WD70_9FLAO|nr:M28 family peptidase [Robiginitalea aurantiaca]MDM9630874.1 M28 family peptidase [Robiginitalea aurantiaca]